MTCTGFDCINTVLASPSGTLPSGTVDAFVLSFTANCPPDTVCTYLIDIHDDGGDFSWTDTNAQPIPATYTQARVVVSGPPGDTTPDPFILADQPDVPLSTPITSAPVAVTGITVPTPISVSGDPTSQYSINGGAFTSAAGSVSNGNTVRVRHTSAVVPDATVDTTLNIGGVTDTFTSTTAKYAFDDSVSTAVNQAIVIDVLDNDVGFADPVYVGIWVNPAHGTVSVTATPAPQDQVRITYTPHAGYVGSDSFQYWVESGSVVDYAVVSVEVLDDDADDDGIVDVSDNCPQVANPGQQDGDGDTVGNVCDNCTFIGNADQRDTNIDGYGNICDADLNDTGLVTSADYFILRSRLNTADADADLNGSGVVTSLDYFILRSRLNTIPGPSGLHP
jgi:hypothetical protein